MFASSVALTLAALFAISGMEKVRTLARGTARWHPMLSSSRLRRRFAVELLVLGVVLDLVAGAGSIAGGRFAWSAISVIFLYSIVAMTSPAVRRERGASCQCFPLLFDVRGGTALAIRNLVLAVATAKPAAHGGSKQSSPVPR